MKKIKLLRLLSFLLIVSMALGFKACSDDDDDPVPVEALITAFSITNAGASQDVVVEGVINNFDILVVAPFETNLTALMTDITVSEGASVVPASGTALDFSEMRNFVVTNGDLSNTYQVTVELAEPTVGAITEIRFVSATSGMEYPSTIDQIAKEIVVTFNNLQDPLVIIDHIALAPPGTTYETSGDGDQLNLSESQTITLSFAGEQTVYTVIPNITQAGFNPENTQVLLNFSAAANAVPAIINDNNSRNAAFNGRYVVVPTRKEGNEVRYWDLQNPGADPGSLEFGGVVGGGAWAVSDVQMVGEHIYVSNMIHQGQTQFRVYRWNGVDDENPEVILDYDVGEPVAPASTIRLGDAISIIGDPSTNGYIIASNFPFQNQNNQFYVWKFENGQPGTHQIWTVNPELSINVGQYGRINAIPGETNRFLVSGAEMPVAIIEYGGNVLYEIPAVVNGGVRAYDPNIFDYNDGRYLTYTFNNEGANDGAYLEVVNITGPDDVVEALQQLTEDNIADRRVYKNNFGTMADLWISARNGVAFSNDGKPRVMGFTVQNGFIVVEFSN